MTDNERNELILLAEAQINAQERFEQVRKRSLSLEPGVWVEEVMTRQRLSLELKAASRAMISAQKRILGD